MSASLQMAGTARTGDARTGDARTGDAASVGSVVRLGADDRSSQRIRIVDAALRCLGRQGIARTTVDDIAREAGISRATLYRTFPGGRDAVLTGVAETEIARFFSALAVTMGEADDLEDVLVAGMVAAAGRLRTHAALAGVLRHEPEAVLTHLSFAKFDALLEVASDFAAPFFARWLGPDEASRAAEWAARIVVSYLVAPPPATDLTDPAAARRLVATFVLPGVVALGSARAPHPTADPNHQ